MWFVRKVKDYIDKDGQAHRINESHGVKIKADSDRSAITLYKFRYGDKSKEYVMPTGFKCRIYYEAEKIKESTDNG